MTTVLKEAQYCSFSEFVLLYNCYLYTLAARQLPIRHNRDSRNLEGGYF